MRHKVAGRRQRRTPPPNPLAGAVISRGRQYETDMIRPPTVTVHGQQVAPEDVDKWIAKFHEANATRRPYMLLGPPMTVRPLRWWERLRLRLTGLCS